MHKNSLLVNTTVEKKDLGEKDFKDLCITGVFQNQMGLGVYSGTEAIHREMCICKLDDERSVTTNDLFGMPIRTGRNFES